MENRMSEDPYAFSIGGHKKSSNSISKKKDGNYYEQPPITEMIVQDDIVNLKPPVLFSPPAPVVQLRFGREERALTCPFCYQKITTLTTKKVSGEQILFCVILCYVCCCCMPFCEDSAYDIQHNCPYCREIIGKQNVITRQERQQQKRQINT